MVVLGGGGVLMSEVPLEVTRGTCPHPDLLLVLAFDLRVARVFAAMVDPFCVFS